MAVQIASHPTTPAGRREQLGAGVMIGYGAGNFAFALLGLVVAVNFQFFYTDYVGLSAGFVSWALLIARLFDAFVDPLMGYASDRTHTRIGRRRPYMLGSALPLGIAFYYLFAPPDVGDPAQHQVELLIYMVGLYTVTYFIWTVGSIPYYSLGAEMTDDYHERTQLISVREGWGLAGLLAATILPAYLIHLYGGRTGYGAMGAILGLGTSVFLLYSGVVVRERPEFQGRPAMNPYAGIIATLRNRPFRVLLMAFAFSAIAGAVPAVLVIYVAVYIIGTPEWWARSIPDWLPTWSYYLLLYFLCAVLSLPLWNRMAHRFGKRATWGAAIVLATLTSAACYWLAEGTIGFFSVILVLGGVSFGNYQALPPSMVADLIDHDEVETGGRREGAYFALWSFVIKAGNAITGFAALQVLEHVGYTPGVPQSDTVKHWMLWMYSWFPALFYLLSGIVLLRFNFTRADLDAAQRRLGRAK
ncbi:MAG TPA: MFS transporter [Candidatus Binatia bacterium]|nr:MFS transporter [Candidatus Binatia bacterium]